MRLNLLATGRFLTMLPVTMLRHPSNRAWLRALAVDLGETAGANASITLKKRPASGAVKLFVDESSSICQNASWVERSSLIFHKRLPISVSFPFFGHGDR